MNILTLIIKRIKTNHIHLNKRTVLFTHPISCYIIKKTCKVTHADNLWILLCLWSFDVDKSLAYGNKSTSLNFHWPILYGHYMSQWVTIVNSARTELCDLLVLMTNSYALRMCFDQRRNFPFNPSRNSPVHTVNSSNYVRIHNLFSVVKCICNPAAKLRTCKSSTE